MSPHEVYDGFMAVIEPELLTSNLTKLDEGYEWETPQDRADRYANYDYAFVLLHEAMEDWAAAMKADEMELSAIAESFSYDDDAQELKSINHSLNEA